MTADDDSIIPVDITDHEGNPFPAGSILNLCVADVSESQALDRASYDVVEQRPESPPNGVGLWVVDYRSSDRSRITLREEDDGRYLAKLGQGVDAEVVWDYVPFWWIVCRGRYKDSFTLSNDQGYFLRAWSDNNEEATLFMGLCGPPYPEHEPSPGNSATSWVLQTCAESSSRSREMHRIEQRSRSTSPTIAADEDFEARLVPETIDPVEASKAVEDTHSGFERGPRELTVNEVNGNRADLIYDSSRPSGDTQIATSLSVKLDHHPPPMTRPSDCAPPDRLPPRILPSQDMPPQELPPQSIPPQSIPPQMIPPQMIPPQMIPPQMIPPQMIPPQRIPPQSIPPKTIPPQIVPPQSIPSRKTPPRSVPSLSVPPRSVPSRIIPPQRVSP